MYINAALLLMLYGLIGVFSALIIFYGIIKLMIFLMPYKAEEEEQS